VVVSFCSLDESERTPPTARTFLAALPTRATRVMNGNHTAFFNAIAADPVWAVSHKV
jgi:hypothetical protein